MAAVSARIHAMTKHFAPLPPILSMDPLLYTLCLYGLRDSSIHQLVEHIHSSDCYLLP